MKKGLYVGNKGVFYNSECLFVEYNDVISCPWYVLLCFVKNNEGVEAMFDTTEIRDLNYEELMEWYIYRKYRNIYKNLPLRGGRAMSDKELDKFLYDQMTFSESFYTTNIALTFSVTLKYASQQKMLIKKIVIYSEYMNDFLRSEIKEKYPDAFIMDGDFREVLKEIPMDSTFILSDLNKVNIMAEEKHLNYSSIIIPDGFRYNLMPHDSSKYIADIDELHKKYVFKLDFFNNFKVL